MNIGHGLKARNVVASGQTALVGITFLLACTVPAQPRAAAAGADAAAPRLVVQSGPRNPVGLQLTLSPDKRLVATAGGERSGAYIWQVESGRLFCRLQADLSDDMSFLRQGLPPMTFSLDGSQLATANDRGISVWDVRGCRLQRSLPGGGGGRSVPGGMLTLPDGQVLASSEDGTLRKGSVFAGTGTLLAVPKAPHRSELIHGASRDGRLVLSSGVDGNSAGPFAPSRLRVVDLQTGAVDTLETYQGAPATGGVGAMPRNAAMSRSGRWVVESHQGFATLFDRQARTVTARVPLADAAAVVPAKNAPVARAPEMPPEVAKMLKSMPPSPMRTELEQQLKSMAATVSRAQQTAEGGQGFMPGWVGFSDSEDLVYLWKNPALGSSPGAPLRPDQRPTMEIRRVPSLSLVSKVPIQDPAAVNREAAAVATSFSASRDGTALAIAMLGGDMAGGRTGVVDLTQLPSQVVVRGWKPTGSGAGRIAWTPDGQLVALHGGAVGGGATASLSGRGAMAPALAPAPAAPNARTLLVHWSLGSGEVATHGTAVADILPFAVSAGGRFAAMLKADRRGGRPLPAGYRIEVVDTQTRQPAFESALQGIESSVAPWFPGLAISPDGRRLAVLVGVPGEDRPHLSLHDTATGRLLAQQSLPLEAGEYSYLQAKIRFTADGTNLLMVGHGAGGELLRIAVSERGALKVDTVKVGAALVDVAGDGPLRLLVQGDAGAVAGAGLALIHLPNERWGLAASNSAGTQIAAAREDGGVRLFDVAPGGRTRESTRLDGHAAMVVSLAFSPDGRLLASSDEQGTTLVWDLAKGAILARLFAFTDGSWAVVDPQGRFDTNRLEDLEYLHWVMPDDPLRALPLDIFMREYFTPGLLGRVMRAEALPEVRPVAALNRAQPVVRIAAVVPSRTDPQRVDVTVEAEGRVDTQGRPGGVADLRLFRDGRLVGYPERPGEPLKLDPQTQRASTTFRNIRLPQGADAVAFSAYAFNGDRVKGATARSEYRVPPGTRPRQKGKAYVIAIGVNRSDNPAYDLGFAANDARVVSELLTARLTAGQGFREVVAVPLVSDGDRTRDATKARIRAVLAVLAGRPADRGELGSVANMARLEAATPDDLVIITFSGHGHAGERGVFHLLPQDIGAGSGRQVTPQLLARTITSDELETWLRDVDAGELALVIDACQSAASVEGEGFKPGPMGSRGLGQLAYDKGMRVLAASQADGVAREPAGLRHGLLTYVLMRDGIEARRADFKPADKRILLAEWLAYGVQGVPQLQRDLMRGERAPDGSARPVERLGKPATSLQQPRLFDFSRQGEGPAIDVLR